MIRVYGKATVTTWRPYEQANAPQMRAFQRESEDVTVLDQIVMLQHQDGYWETYPLSNCQIVWRGKPTITLLTEENKETVLPLVGRERPTVEARAPGSPGPTAGQ